MHLTFRDGDTIPAIGLGTWPMDDAEAERVVAEAIDLGYRLVDTAFAYGNEAGVGRGVAASSVPRDEVFLTSKFNAPSHSVAGVARAWEDAVRRMGIDYLDLFLIHWPNPAQDRYVEAWEGLIALKEQGRVRHIGTSNFLPEHLDRIIDATGVVPELDQLQINPRYLQADARAYNAERGIVTQSWSPLGQDTGLVELPVFAELASAYECTPGQVIVAWHLAMGMCTIPKSSNRQRLTDNLAAQEISLRPEDIASICALDGTEPDIKHPNEFGH